ncbi:hypothetical protein [Octadecabacter ascidiaceicola]|uniref:DUF2125 domain-containing protein n=1 Tax=Octadecabacter ascidiaceicola TaxID=1655543 RepID=A0A238K3J5_9RHOB|nr:hypothetical protein [Octadecabacter ascidiaceicola]SMX37469.1 hypothetical protein OCA8868_01458 [Octadecabacter ascidiaceicola]
MRCYVFAALMVCAGQVSAQERMELSTCQYGWAAVVRLIASDAQLQQISVTDDGWCQIDDLKLLAEPQTNFKVETLRWRASDMERFVEQGLPPRSLEIVGVGVSIAGATGDRNLDYLMGLQAAVPETGFGVFVRWDGVQNAVFVDEAYVDFSAENRIEATARVDGVDLSDQTAMQTSIGSMGLKDLVVTTQFSGWFETYLALPVGYGLLREDGPEPEIQVQELQSQVIEIIYNLPEEIVPGTSKEALGSFVQSLPTPRGAARLQLSANPPLGASRMTPFALMADTPALDEIVELGLDGVDLLFTWNPKGGN